MNTLEKYINENFLKTVRYNREPSGSRLGLPYPYTVPCISDRFQEMYYWDTYFTNLGLIPLGNVKQAENNVRNVAYLIDTYGFMPNGSRTDYLTRSQPPFFSQMIRDVFEVTQDKAFLSQMYSSLKTEYEFWQKERLSPSLLNHYASKMPNPKGSADYFCRRIGIKCGETQSEINSFAACSGAFCESGWDCNSRFGLRAHEFDPIDLNSLLYLLEKNAEYFCGVLKNGEDSLWRSRANARRERLNSLCFNTNKGMLCDYDFVNKKQSDFVSCAVFYPLFAFLATERQAEKIKSLLPLIECEYGVACCQASDGLMNLQWDYPHGWACLQYIVISALDRYGYTDDAVRIASKYTSLAEKIFEKTGNLWEKYNVVTGDVSVTKEYSTPPMMGWSAGVYLFCKQYLSR